MSTNFFDSTQNLRREVFELHRLFKQNEHDKREFNREKDQKIKNLKNAQGSYEKQLEEIRKLIEKSSSTIRNIKGEQISKDYDLKEKINANRQKIANLSIESQKLEALRVKLNEDAEKETDVFGDELNAIRHSEQLILEELQNVIDELKIHEQQIAEYNKKNIEEKENLNKLILQKEYELGKLVMESEEKEESLSKNASMLTNAKQNTYSTKPLPESNPVVIPPRPEPKTPVTARKVIDITTPSQGEESDETVDYNDQSSDDVEIILPFTASKENTTAQSNITSSTSTKPKKFGVVYDEIMMSHEQPEEDHLEIAKRIQVIYGRLIKEEFFNRSSVLRIKSRKVSENELLLCHDKSYIDEINDIVKNSKPFPGDDYSTHHRFMCD